MKHDGNRSMPAPADHLVPSRYLRIIAFLVGISCLSIGMAVGMIIRGTAAATPEDNRLAISHSTTPADALSAAFARVSAEVEPSVVHIKVSEGEDRVIVPRQGTGSGVIVNSAGFILTNQHVVRRASKITVKLFDGSEYQAKVLGQDTQTDLAVIKIEAPRSLPVARMGDSDRLKVGDWVLAIGSPFGLEQTVTAGIISAKDRDTESGGTPFQQFLQTDAAINPGNSGGPLVSLAGEVVGINTQIATGSGVYNGVGFALPSATAVEVYNQLISTGRVRRGFLGIRPEDLKPQLARLNRISDNQGVTVDALTSEESPAGRAGLQPGDVIVGINSRKVTGVRQLIRLIASLPVGSTARVDYYRNGEQHSADVKLEERMDESGEPFDIRQTPFDPRNPRLFPEREEPRKDEPKIKPGLGINVRNLTPDIVKQRGLEGARGVYVTSVDPASIAEENEVKAGDVITQINYKPITSMEDFQRLTRDLKSGDDVFLKVLRRERGPLVVSRIMIFTMP